MRECVSILCVHVFAGNFVRYACDQLRALKEGVKSCLDTFQSLHRTLSPPCTTVKGLDCPTGMV